MLTDAEIAEMRAKAVANSDRDKRTGTPVALVRCIRGPLDEMTIALTEPAPSGGYFGWPVPITRRLIQALYCPDNRPGPWRIAEYLDHRGGMG